MKKSILFISAIAIFFVMNKPITILAAQDAHVHYFDQHYRQNAGYSVAATHDYLYGEDPNGNVITKQCYAVDVHAYYYIGCNCGALRPNTPSHDHVYYTNHPVTSDTVRCTKGMVYHEIPRDFNKYL